MNTPSLAFAFLFGALIFNPIAPAMSFPPEVQRISLEGKLNCPYISSHGGTAYLQISLSSSDIIRPRRRPMNLAVVLDRSGSMADAGKIEYARQALLKLVDQLESEDIFSLVVYDDVIEVPFAARSIESKAALRRLVEGIYPRGSTNLGGGMMEGFRQVERNLRKEFVNRVVLLSDGLANQGITDPRELNRIARQCRGKSISLTTMGVGLEYNENLMVGLSEAGGGNYYFIESPHNLASIMGRELNTLSSVIAQNGSIELTLGRGVQVNDVIGCEHSTDGGKYIIPVGDLYANDHREFTVELFIPEGAGTCTVVTGALNYESDGKRIERARGFAVKVQYTHDVAVIEKNKDWSTQAKADVALSTRTVEKAMRALDEGRQEEAEQTLNEAKQVLSASPAGAMSGAGADAIREQAAKLEVYSSTLKDKRDDVRGAKKSIQYDNYRTQRKK
jgi:Ca-activated chloride channel family protein